jgi:hypothetical protein
MAKKSKKTVKLQIPISENLRNRVQVRAEEFGFNSLQGFVRYMLTQFDRGAFHPTFTNSYPDEYLTAKAEARLDAASKELNTDIKTGKARFARNAEELMQQLDELNEADYND